jgi:hypothetical protein
MGRRQLDKGDFDMARKAARVKRVKPRRRHGKPAVLRPGSVPDNYKARKPAAAKRLHVRKVSQTAADVVRVVAHKDVVHQAVVHTQPGVVEIVPVTRPVEPLKKPGTWLQYLFGDFAS